VFEAQLADRLKRIFDFKKVSYNHINPKPDDVNEQETLFITVQSSKNSIKEGVSYARVTAKVTVRANSDKLPYMYFSKKIQEADISDTKDFFFYDLESNDGTYDNITDRSFSFVFFFNSQYDPDIGTLNTLTFQQVSE
jgi:hypothetical protein